MMIKILQNKDYIEFKETIRKLLSESYYNNFNISKKLSNEISNEKISQLDEYIQTEKAILLGAVKKNKLIGFIWVYKHEYFGEHRLHVNQVVIDVENRKEGIGEKLILEIEKFAKQLDIKVIDLFVTDSNNSAIKLYEKLGFKTKRRYLEKKIWEETKC